MKMSIKNKKVIDNIFKIGKSISRGSILVKIIDSGDGFVFAVSSKKFKRAVDRNKIKRLMRESVKGFSTNKGIALIYIGNEVPNFNDVKNSIDSIFKKYEV
jgi:ribonuclease P protein component